MNTKSDRSKGGFGLEAMVRALEKKGETPSDYENALRIALAEVYLGKGGGGSIVTCRFAWPDSSPLIPIMAGKPERENYPSDEVFEEALGQFKERVQMTLDEVWRLHRLKS